MEFFRVRTGNSVIAIVFVLLLSLFLPSSHSAQKITAGASCKGLNKKVDYKNKTYTCIKKGNKLVWSKGVAIKNAAPAVAPSPTASPIPSPTPTPTPTPTQSSFEAWTLNIDVKSLSDQAQENFLSWTKGRVGVTINHTQIIQVNSNVNRISILKRSDDLVAQLFSSYFPQGSVTVIGATESWTTEELSKNGWLTTCRNQSMPGVAYCLSNTRHHGYVVTGDATYDPRNPGSDGGALLAHEYFHLVQANLSQTTSGVRTKSGDANSANAFPAWFLEGTAEFVGYSVAALSQSASFWDGRARMLSYAPPEESINKNAIADYEIRTCCGNNTPTYPYNIGQVATEYIVASIGFQKMLDIWIDYATTRNFEKSFERVTGISKIAFYEKFDQIRTKVGLPAISWRLEGLVNKKISN